MKRKISVFIHNLAEVVKLIFTRNHPKPMDLTEDQKGKLIKTLGKCYRCDGTGQIQAGLGLGGNIPSKFGGWGSSDGRSPYITCPICKGSGCKETLQSNSSDKGENIMKK